MAIDVVIIAIKETTPLEDWSDSISILSLEPTRIEDAPCAILAASIVLEQLPPAIYARMTIFYLMTCSTAPIGSPASNAKLQEPVVLLLTVVPPETTTAAPHLVPPTSTLRCIEQAVVICHPPTPNTTFLHKKKQ